jgi:argininosuccinate lyase
MKLWGGRFAQREMGANDALMERFNASIPFDWRLYDADIDGSVAYAAALVRQGLIDQGEADDLTRGLEQVRAEWKAGTFDIRTSDEDIHTANERRLRALVERARAEQDALMPGYTHLQRAQPVPVAHWLLHFFWPLERDRARLHDLRRRVNVMPLGAGALAGNALDLDRATLAESLGFDAVTPNSMDAVADRDFVAEMLFVGALIGTHLSRLAEDLIIYSSTEFGFVTIADTFSTGSSLMPQKKNPDSLELTRGKSGRLVGNLVSLLTVLKGLPSTYNKDLQEDKEPLFDTLLLVLPVVTGVIETMTVNRERMAGALDDAMLATDLADELVRAGVPFREAHGLSGTLVRRAEERRVALRDLEDDDVRAVHPALVATYRDVFDMRRSADTRVVVGGTAATAMEEQLAAAEAVCEKDGESRASND